MPPTRWNGCTHACTRDTIVDMGAGMPPTRWNGTPVNPDRLVVMVIVDARLFPVIWNLEGSVGMAVFAGTFHKGRNGDWVPCMTVDGRPCSRHSGSAHMTGDDLESALESLHSHDIMGGLSSVVHDEVPDDVDIRDIAHRDFTGVADAVDMDGELRSIADSSPMTDADRDAIRGFAGGMYDMVNRYLYDDGEDRDELRMEYGMGGAGSLDDYMSSLGHGVSSCSAPEDMIVYRRRYTGYGDYDDGAIGHEEAAFRDAADDGGSYRKSDYSSTSVSPGMIGAGGTDSTSYVIMVPRGTHGIRVHGDLAEREDEGEFLLDAGLDYRVVAIHERPCGHPIISLAVVHDA